MTVQDIVLAPKSYRRQISFLVLSLSVVALSCGSIMIRAADAPASVIACWRVAIASFAIVPFAFIARRRELASLSRETMLICFGAGILLAIHFLLWTQSLKLTTVANSVMLANTSPIWIVLGGLLLRRRRLSVVSATSLLACMVGAVLVSWQGLSIGGDTLKGDMLALLAGVALAGYLLLAAKAVSTLSTPVYMALTYPSAAFILACISLIQGNSLISFDTNTFMLFCVLGLLSQLLGHGGPSWTLKSLTPGFVSQFLLADLIISPVLASYLFSEQLTLPTILGGATIIFGLIVGTSEASI